MPGIERQRRRIKRGLLAILAMTGFGITGCDPAMLQQLQMSFQQIGQATAAARNPGHYPAYPRAPAHGYPHEPGHGYPTPGYGSRPQPWPGAAGDPHVDRYAPPGYTSRTRSPIGPQVVQVEPGQIFTFDSQGRLLTPRQGLGQGY